MRSFAIVFLGLLVTLLSLPTQALAFTPPKSGANCDQEGNFGIYGGKLFSCVKNNKKLVWRVNTNFIAGGLCSEWTPGDTKSWAELQLFKNDAWVTQLLPIAFTPGPPCDTGKVRNSIPWVALPKKIAEGTKYRWKYSAGQNSYVTPSFKFSIAAMKIPFLKVYSAVVQPISGPDLSSSSSGSNSTSAPIKTPPASSILVPHTVEGGYGITWDNVLSKINDISAAAWTDAQATIARNKNLPSALSGFKSYISPGALATDPNIGEAETYLKRTFALFARVPAPKNVIFVATTQEERLATKTQIDSLYQDNNWIKIKLDDIYGINTDQPQGSVFTSSQCNGNDPARSASTYPNGTTATALIISVCPDIGRTQTHINGVHGMAHEYVHSIQVAVLVNVLDRQKFEPCWLREGAPEWTQSVVSSDFDQYLTTKHLHPYLLTSNGLKYEQTTARKWSADEVDAYLKRADDPKTCEATNEYALAYSLGEVATETLVSIGGSESFFALQELLAKGVSSNEAFLKVYGKTWDDVRPILAKVIAEQITLSWAPEAYTAQTRPKV